MQLWQLEVNEKGGIDIVPAFFKKEEDEEQEQKKGDSVQSYYTPQMGPAPNTYAFCSMQRDLRGETGRSSTVKMSTGNEHYHDPYLHICAR